MMEEILSNTDTRMDSSVADARHKLATVRTGPPPRGAALRSAP